MPQAASDVVIDRAFGGQPAVQTLPATYTSTGTPTIAATAFATPAVFSNDTLL